MEIEGRWRRYRVENIKALVDAGADVLISRFSYIW